MNMVSCFTDHPYLERKHSDCLRTSNSPKEGHFDDFLKEDNSDDSLHLRLEDSDREATTDNDSFVTCLGEVCRFVPEKGWQCQC